jgi:hypothetical protein
MRSITAREGLTKKSDLFTRDSTGSLLLCCL